MKRGIFYLFAVLILNSCVEIANPYTQLPPGIWRAELKIDDFTAIPFNFEIGYEGENNGISMTLINGPERIPVDHIEFGKNKRLLDTVYIDFPLLDSEIKAIYKENIIEGFWKVRNRENYVMPFVAYYGKNHRFTQNAEKPIMDVSGSWQARFEIETADEYPGIGEFVADKNQLLGTFRTETGDYRYLQGEVQGDQLMLSCFDGSHAFLFEAKIREDSTMFGKFYSGNHYVTNWVAKKTDSPTLTSPYELTQPKDPDKELNFELFNADGKLVTLQDDRYRNKAKLIMLMGTWCPNCLEESRFIMDYLSNNPNNQLEVIAIAFERYRDEDKAISTIKSYRDRLGIPYEILYGGYYDKKEATEKFQFLDEIISYPTLLFVNKDNKVTKVHTGYNGTATSKFLEFKDEFEAEIQNISL